MQQPPQQQVEEQSLRHNLAELVDVNCSDAALPAIPVLPVSEQFDMQPFAYLFVDTALFPANCEFSLASQFT